MDQNPNSKSQFFAKLGIVVLVGAMTVATLSLLMISMVQLHYTEFNSDTWFSFAVPPAMWAAFCAFSVWAIFRLKRSIGRPAAAKTFGIAGFAVFIIIGLSIWIIFTS